MSLLSHKNSLENKHSEIEDAILAEMARPLPDFIKISALKKKKLLLKQEIFSVQSEYA